MTFQIRDSFLPIIVIGDIPTPGKDVRTVVEGRLLGIRKHDAFHNPLYDLALDHDVKVSVPGCVSMNQQLSEADIGKIVRFRFLGWGETKAGEQFKKVEVAVDEAVAESFVQSS